MVAGLITAGMRVARLNFSHGDHEAHLASVEVVRAASEEVGVPVALLMDLQGPKIRTGRLRNQQMALNRNAEVELVSEAIVGDGQRIGVGYAHLHRDLDVGDDVFIDDGALHLRVTQKRELSLICRVITPGILKENKGVNLPDIEVDTPSLTEKDLSDLDFPLISEIDYVALSFVRKGSDLSQLREQLKMRGCSARIIAKLEKPQAIDELDSIIDASDAVMVARGDLGVEMSPERVPILQKMIIDRANRARTPVITATQMLESMIESPRPTRAEASDVANAILDGTDAVMLSGETAVGENPVAAVQFMARIAQQAEEALLAASWKDRYLIDEEAIGKHSGTHAIGHAACQAAEDLSACCIACYTHTGGTALLISKFRPRADIIATTPSEAVARRAQLYWGVDPVVAGAMAGTDDLLDDMASLATRRAGLDTGDSVIITAGVPVLGKGKTNLMKLHKVE